MVSFFGLEDLWFTVGWPLGFSPEKNIGTQGASKIRKVQKLSKYPTPPGK